MMDDVLVRYSARTENVYFKRIPIDEKSKSFRINLSEFPKTVDCWLTIDDLHKPRPPPERLLSTRLAENPRATLRGLEQI